LVNGEFTTVVACFVATWASIGGLYYKIGRMEGALFNSCGDWGRKIKKKRLWKK